MKITLAVTSVIFFCFALSRLSGITLPIVQLDGQAPKFHSIRATEKEDKEKGYLVSRDWRGFSDKEIVHLFISKLLQDTEAGYSIYGEKPIYLGTFCHPEYLVPGSDEHQESNLNFLALDILKGVNNNPKNSQGKCVLISQGTDLSYCHDFMIINRPAFHEAVEANKSLFKMSFGKDISSDQLFKDLSSTPNGFGSLFRGKQALQGILLGYGQENAITYQRALPYKQAILSPQPHPPNALPPILYGESLIWAQQERFKNNPEWEKVYEEMQDFDCHLLINPEDNLNVFFSFHKNSHANQKLIEGYKRAQQSLNHILASPNLLRQTLKFLGINSQSIQEFSRNNVQRLLAQKKEQITIALSKAITITFDEYITTDFFRGMQDAERLSEKEIETYSEEALCFEIIRRKSLSLEPLKERAAASKKILEKVAQQPGITCLLDKYIYFETLQATQSKKSVSAETQFVHIKYLIEDMDNNLLDGTYTLEKINKFALKDLIPGLAHGLIGMKKGEIRQIHIHPEFAYGLNSDYGNGKTLQVKIELVELENSGDHTTHLPCLQFCTVRHIAPKIRTTEAFDNLRKRYSYLCGFKTWFHYKKAKPMVDLGLLIEKLQENRELPSHDERIMLSYLNQHIYRSEQGE